jgi:hypothetical protein
MPTWKELDQEFQALAQSLRHYNLQYQWGAAGTYYHLSGGPSFHATERFEALAMIAGGKIQQLPVGTVLDEVLQSGDYADRWYEALRHHSGSFEHGIFGHQTDADGNDLGSIYSGSINQPAHASAILALQFTKFDPPAHAGGAFINVGQQGGVVSVGQQGNINAPQVFHAAQVHQQAANTRWWTSTASMIAAAVAFVAAVVAILTWFGIEPHPNAATKNAAVHTTPN